MRHRTILVMREDIFVMHDQPRILAWCSLVMHRRSRKPQNQLLTLRESLGAAEERAVASHRAPRALDGWLAALQRKMPVTL